MGMAQGDAAQVQHIKNIGIAKFVGNGKGHAVHFCQRSVRFQSAERGLVLAQNVASGAIRRHDPLCPPAFMGIDNAIENLLPKVGHAHFVEIGKGQGHAQANFIGLLANSAFLYTGIAAGSGQNGQKFTHGFLPEKATKKAAHTPPRGVGSPPERSGNKSA